jgi:hypothetical protein
MTQETPIERIELATEKANTPKILLSVRDVKLLLTECKTWKDYAVQKTTEGHNL